MNTHKLTTDRRGMTLAEILIVLMVFGVVITGALAFMSTQNTAFHKGLDRMNALQNLRYAFEQLETDLKTLGTNLPADQPSLVYAGDDVVAFSADYASNVANDIFSVFYEPGAPTGQVTALTYPITIPNTSFGWPDSAYTTAAGTNSPGELLVFYFEADTATTRTDDYVMMRQVNFTSPEVVARNILKSGSEPFFRYVRRKDYSSQPSEIDTIPMASLPIMYFSSYHGSVSDTGSSALADSVRAVKLAFGSTNGRAGEHEKTAEMTRVVMMPNAGLSLIKTCGDEPMLGFSGILVSLGTTGGGDTSIDIVWSPALDETAGEKDVIRYVIWRRIPPSLDWADPYLSVPAGQTNYLYQDTNIVTGIGQQYEYAVAAQDCTPSLSGMTTPAQITVP